MVIKTAGNKLFSNFIDIPFMRLLDNEPNHILAQVLAQVLFYHLGEILRILAALLVKYDI